MCAATVARSMGEAHAGRDAKKRTLKNGAICGNNFPQIDTRAQRRHAVAPLMCAAIVARSMGEAHAGRDAKKRTLKMGQFVEIIFRKLTHERSGDARL